MCALGTAHGSAPVMFGQPAPPGELLPWDWAERRLVAAVNYWIATAGPAGRPHCRPVWGVWLPDGFWFSTGSVSARNLSVNAEITVHLESGQEVVIVEGTAREVRDQPSLHAMCEAYGPKYDYPVAPTPEGTVADSSGTGGPAYLVTPRAVFGWDADMTSPTKWTFGR